MLPVLPTLVFLSASVLPQEDPARLLPSDTLIYFGTNGVRQAAEAARNTAMAKIMGEAEVRAFLREPTRAAEAVLGALLKQYAGGLEGFGGGAEISAQVSLDLANQNAPPIGQVFFGLTHVTLPSPSSPNAVPEVGVVLGVEVLDEPSLGLVRSIWEGLPLGEAGAFDHGGANVLVRTIPEAGLGVYLTVLGQLAVLSTSESTIRGVIDRHRGSADVSSLRDSKEYQQLLAAAGGNMPVGTTAHLLRVNRIAELVVPALPMALGQAGAGRDEIGVILQIVGELGLDAMQMVGGISRISPDGHVLSTSVLSVAPNHPGLIARLMAPGEPVDPAILTQLPAGALSANAGYLGDQLARLYDFAMDVVGRVEPLLRKEVEANLAQLMGEANLREDILANVGGRFVAFTERGEGLLGVPETMGRIGVKDGDRFVGAVKALIGRAAGQIAEVPISLRESSVGDLAVFEIDLSATPLAVMGIQPAFAIRGGELVFSNSSRRLKAWAGEDPSREQPTLAENVGLAAFLGRLASEGGVQTIAFGDNAGNFASAYGQLVGAAQMFSGLLGDIPVDMSKLPPEGTITRHLDESYSGTTVTPDGLVVTQAVSQFQLADFLPMALVFGLVGLGQTQAIETAPVVHEIDPLELAQNHLREIKASTTVYKFSMQRYPESLEDLVQPLPEFPDGTFPGGVLPVDPWGQGYRYTLVEDASGKLKPRFWSCGPNQIDESGAGDDIVKT